MKENRKTNIKVGITILITIILLIFIIIWAKNISLSSNNYLIKIKFNSVAGLEKGDHITINGVKKGKVEDIYLDGSKVVVIGIIPSDIILKTDAKAYVEMMDLMGGKKVEIYPGQSSELFNKEMFLLGISSTDVPGAMKIIGESEEDLKYVLKDIRSILSVVNKNIQDEKLANQTKQIISDLNSITKNLNILLNNNSSSLQNTIQNTEELTSNMNSFTKKNFVKLDSIISSSNDMVSNFNLISKDIQVLLNEIKNKENTLGVLLYDSQIKKELVESLHNLNSLTNILSKQLDSTGIKVEAKIKLR